MFYTFVQDQRLAVKVEREVVIISESGISVIAEIGTYLRKKV